MGTVLRTRERLDGLAIVEILKEEIARDKLKPGQRLTEIELMERFKITRNKVREALKRLDAESFVKITPNVGAVVTELSQKDIEHSYDLMGVLEGLAARVAAPYVTSRHLKTLQLLVDRMEAAHELATFFLPNDKFHTLIAALSENDQLIRITDNLRFKLRRFGLRALSNPRQMTASKLDHRKILEAIRDNKPEKAEQLIRDHYVDAKNRLIKGMNKSL